MARPRKGEELKATHTIGVRVPADLRAKLEAMAERNGRSITDEARAALEKHAGFPADRKRGKR
jgi:plasmid stability protein